MDVGSKKSYYFEEGGEREEATRAVFGYYSNFFVHVSREGNLACMEY